MAFSLKINDSNVSINSNTAVSHAITTTGANLYVVGVVTNGSVSATITDSLGTNTYTSLTSYANSGTICQLFYAKNANAGVNMTFTATATGGHPTIFVQAWGGADLTAPFDQQNGNTAASGTTYQPGSVTPGSANELIVSLLFGAGSGTTTIDSSFTISDQLASTANAMAGGMAYLIQTSAAAVNPTWTRGGIGNVGPASIATFKIPVTAIFLPQRLAFNQAVNRAATY